MPVNPNIAMGFQGIQLENPMNAYANMMKLQSLQQEQSLNALKMRQAGAAERNEAEVLNYLRAPGATREGLLKFGAQGLAIGKAMRESDTADATLATAKLTQQGKLQEFVDKLKRELSFNPSPENIKAFAQDSVLHGFMTPEQADAKVQQFLSMNPEQLRATLAGAGASAADLKPTFKDFSIPGKGVQTGTVQNGQFTPGTLYASSDVISAEAEAQKARIARVGRAPVQPRAEPTPAAPVSVVDPVTGQPVLVSREEAISGRMSPASAMTSLTPKEVQKREASYPVASSAVRGFISKAHGFKTDVQQLLNHPGLSEITGIAAGRLPGITANGRAAQALYDKIVAKGGFQALQDMRDASKTGGALGSVSNQEGKQLVASFAAIDRRQDAPDVKAALERVLADLDGAQARMQEAYDDTYSYRTGKPAATPAQPVGLSPEEQAELDALRKRFNK